MNYQIGEVINYRNLNNDKVYYGRIVSINNGFYTVESGGYQRIVDPKYVTGKKE